MIRSRRCHRGSPSFRYELLVEILHLVLCHVHPPCSFVLPLCDLWHNKINVGCFLFEVHCRCQIHQNRNLQVLSGYLKAALVDYLLVAASFLVLWTAARPRSLWAFWLADEVPRSSPAGVRHLDGAPCGEHLSPQGSAGRRNAGRGFCGCVAWWECQWQVRSRWEGLPACLVGVAAGMLYGSVTVPTTVRCALERRRPLWTGSLSLSRDANDVLSLLFSCSDRMQRNILRLKHLLRPLSRHIWMLSPVHPFDFSNAGSVLAAASEARPWSFVCYQFLQWLFSELLHGLFSLLSLQIAGFVDK